MTQPVLERCTDCRKICLCRDECWCMVIDGATGELTCHTCTDNRDRRR